MWALETDELSKEIVKILGWYTAEEDFDHNPHLTTYQELYKVKCIK